MGSPHFGCSSFCDNNMSLGFCCCKMHFPHTNLSSCPSPSPHGLPKDHHSCAPCKRVPRASIPLAHPYLCYCSVDPSAGTQTAQQRKQPLLNKGLGRTRLGRKLIGTRSLLRLRWERLMCRERRLKWGTGLGKEFVNEMGERGDRENGEWNGA